MKLKLFLAFVFLAQTAVKAGDKTGNGGTVLVCGDKVELADFAEVNIRRGLKGKINIPESDEGVEVQLQKALKRISDAYPFLEKPIQDEWKSIQSRKTEIDDYIWTTTVDIGPYPVPHGCDLKNTVLYFEKGPIEVQSLLFQKLSKTHQAGIWAHEIVYKLTRDRTQQDSTLPARRIVALLFADNADEGLLRSLINLYVAPMGDSAYYVMDTSTDHSKYYLKIDASIPPRGTGFQITTAFRANPSSERWSTLHTISTQSIADSKEGDYFWVDVKYVTPFGDAAWTDLTLGISLWKNAKSPISAGDIYEKKMSIIGRDPVKPETHSIFVGLLSPKVGAFLNGIL